MLSVERPDNTSVRTGFSSLIRLTRSDNYIKCNKKLVYPILIHPGNSVTKIYIQINSITTKIFLIKNRLKINALTMFLEECS